MDVPLIRVSPGLSKSTVSDERIRYVVLIQGKSGMSKIKVMIANTLEQAATTMLHEALNGYSTVFSAAYFGRPANLFLSHSVGPANASFQKSTTLRDLATATTDDVVVNLLC